MTLEADTRVLRPPHAASALTGPKLDRLLIGALVVGTATTVLVLLPGIHGHAIVPAIDLVIDTVALVACATLTALGLGSFPRKPRCHGRLPGERFLVLAAAYGIAVVVSLHRSATIRGLAEPEDVQVLVFAVAQLAAAVLFVMAGDFSRLADVWMAPVR